MFFNYPAGSSAEVDYGMETPPPAGVVVGGGSSVATPDWNAAPAPSSVPMSQQRKVGGRFCCCCCDYRRAVIIMSIIYLILTVIAGIRALIYLSQLKKQLTGLGGDDDLSEAFFGELVEDELNQYVHSVYAVTGLGILACLCGIAGALRFNTCLVFVLLVWLGSKSSHEHDSEP